MKDLENVVNVLALSQVSTDTFVECLAASECPIDIPSRGKSSLLSNKCSGWKNVGKHYKCWKDLISIGGNCVMCFDNPFLVQCASCAASVISAHSDCKDCFAGKIHPLPGLNETIAVWE